MQFIIGCCIYFPRAMSEEELNCCIQRMFSRHKEHIHNLTDIFLYTKSCFQPNQTALDILIYVMSEHEEVESCRLEKSNGPQCVDERNGATPAIITLWVVLMLVAVLGNILVCYVIYNTHALSSLIANHFIASLAVSDLLVGLLLVPIRIYSTARTGGFCLHRVLCHLYMTMDNVCFVASITNLLVITADRFVAIDWPYSYQDMITKKRARIAILIVWLYAVIMGGLSNVRWEEAPVNVPENICWTQNKGYVTFVFTAVFYLPALFMGIAQGRMLLIALQHSRDIVSAIPLQNLNKEVSEDHCSSSKKHSKHFVTRMKRVFKDYRAVKMVMVVYGTFVVCWVPVSIIALFHVWCPDCAKLKQWQVVVFVEVLPILNSTLNFFIYAVMNRKFRKAFKKLYRVAYLWCTDDIG